MSSPTARIRSMADTSRQAAMVEHSLPRRHPSLLSSLSTIHPSSCIPTIEEQSRVRETEREGEKEEGMESLEESSSTPWPPGGIAPSRG